MLTWSWATESAEWKCVSVFSPFIIPAINIYPDLITIHLLMPQRRWVWLFIILNKHVVLNKRMHTVGKRDCSCAAFWISNMWRAEAPGDDGCPHRKSADAGVFLNLFSMFPQITKWQSNDTAHECYCHCLNMCCCMLFNVELWFFDPTVKVKL